MNGSLSHLTKFSYTIFEGSFLLLEQREKLFFGSNAGWMAFMGLTDGPPVPVWHHIPAGQYSCWAGIQSTESDVTANHWWGNQPKTYLTIWSHKIVCVCVCVCERERERERERECDREKQRQRQSLCVFDGMNQNSLVAIVSQTNSKKHKSQMLT
jgi:hypothetical protein